MTLHLSRRAALAAALAALAAPAQAAAPLRIVTTELVLTETALALGITPLAAGNLPLYRRLVGRPELPAGVQDLGPLNEPNMELLVWLQPELILAADWQSAPQAVLSRIAPVQWLQTLPFEQPPLPTLRALTTALGTATGRESRAEEMISDMDQSLVAGSSYPEPVVLARLAEDGLGALVFAPGSMVGDVAAALGIRNAVPDAGPFGALPMGLETLLASAAPILSLGPVPKGTVLTRLRRDGALRLAELPAVFPAGGVPTATRLARALPAAMEALA